MPVVGDLPRQPVGCLIPKPDKAVKRHQPVGGNASTHEALLAFGSSMEIMMSVNEGTQTHIDGKEAAGAERRLERRRDEEEADKTRETGQDGQLNLMA